MELEEFKKEIKKVKNKRNTTIKNSYGMLDAFRYYRKHRPKNPDFVITEATYRKFINTVNKLLGEYLLDTGELRLPCDIGSLRVCATKYSPFIKEGKLHYHAPIDWNRTLNLWAEDPESKVAKTLVKVNPGNTYSIKYRHYANRFRHKEYFVWKTSRTLKLKMKDRVKNNQLNCYYKTNLVE